MIIHGLIIHGAVRRPWRVNKRGLQVFRGSEIQKIENNLTKKLQQFFNFWIWIFEKYCAGCAVSKHLSLFYWKREHRRLFGFYFSTLYNSYREAVNFYPYTCLVFHDVDLIPEDDRIDYTCRSSPLHISAGVSTFKYKLFSDKLFGGVVSFKREQFETVMSLILWKTSYNNS